MKYSLEQRQYKDNRGEKITVIQQCSHWLTDILKFVRWRLESKVKHCPVWTEQSWESLSNYCQMLHLVFKVSSEHVNSLLQMLSKSVTFLDFIISQGSAATECRWGGNFCGVYI